MANATSDLVGRPYGKSGRQVEMPVEAASTVYSYTMVSQMTATGGLVATTTASSGDAIGVSQHGADNSAGLISAKRCNVEADCIYVFENDTTNPVTEANLIGVALYAVDDHTVSDTQTASEPGAGYFAGLEPDGRVRVYFMMPASVVLGATSVASTVATRAALAAVAAASRYEGQVMTVQTDYSMWVFDADGTATEDTAQELLVEPDAGTGQWRRADKSFIMKVPIGFANTDGEAIETIPAGFTLRLTGMPYWEVTTGFTGGSSSAIGISTNLTGYTTAGDILGGATGDVAATLVAGDVVGTIGDEMVDTQAFHDLLLIAASEIQFDRITSVFTAGAGFVCLPVAVTVT
jgi:hypothetical protein